MRRLSGSLLPTALTCLCLGGLLVVVPPDAAAFRPHIRDGWTVGISWGLGTGRFIDYWGTEIEVEDGVSPQFRVGRMVSRRWQVSFDYQGWLIEGGSLQTKARRSLQNFLLAVTWFPGDPDRSRGGLYLRFGLGLALGGTALITLDEDMHQGEKVRYDETGVGSMFGFGYEFRILDGFAVGGGLSINTLEIHEVLIDRAWFVPLTLNLAWYFN